MAPWPDGNALNPPSKGDFLRFPPLKGARGDV